MKNIYSEIKILKKLNHPTIVKFYKMLKDEDYYYILMEYIKGGTLLDLINDRKKEGKTITT